MKALKSILLAVLGMALVASAIFLQVNIALNSTVFSGGYFSLMFDHSIKQAQLAQIANELTGSAEAFMPLSDAERQALKEGKATKELKNRVREFEAALKQAVDGKWLAKEAPGLAKGLFAFFSGSANKLPSIDISPLKDAMLDSYVEQFLAGSGGSPKEFDALIAQIELTSGGFVRGGKVNDAAVSQFMQMGRLMGMTMAKETAEDICLKIGNRDRDGSTTEELYEYTVKAVAADMMGGAGMQDKLNLNVLFTSAYGTKDNPVTGFSAMFGGLRGSVMLLSALVFLLLAGAIAAIAGRLKETFRWLGVPLIISGVIGLALPVITLLLRPQITAAFSGMARSGSVELMQILLNWALAYAGGVTIFLFFLCLVFVAIGWVLLALVRKSGSGKHAARRANGNGLVRTVVAVVLLAAIPFSAMLIGKGVMSNVEKYDIMVKAAARQKNLDFGGALMEALGVKAP